MAWNGQCVRILCPCSPLPHAHGVLLLALVSLLFNCIELLCYESIPKVAYTIPANAHAGSRARGTSMGGLYDAATLHALCWTKGDTGYKFYTGKYTNTSQFLCFWACCRAGFFQNKVHETPEALWHSKRLGAPGCFHGTPTPATSVPASGWQI